MADLEIRTVTCRSALGIGAIYTKVGFRPGLLTDAVFVRDALGGAIFAGVVDGETVAAAVALPFPGTGWIGGIAVPPEQQHRGFGESLTVHAMQWLTAQGAVTLQLNATSAGLPLYQRLGFHPDGECAQFTGVVPAGITDKTRPARPFDLPAALALDRAATGEDRSSLLELAWPHGAQIYESDGQIIGYRATREPGSLGAIVTDGSREAEGLLSALLSGVAGSGERTICLPVGDTAAVGQVLAAGFHETTRTTRMYAGPRLSWKPERLLGMFNLFWG
jgi:GNAT superfamily N-acetyltransferase